MSKLKIEHGASSVRWALLKTTIEESIANDIDLMCQWSQNDRKYVINELLRFALTAAQDFQKHKAELSTSPSRNNPKPEPPASGAKPVSNSVLKTEVPAKSA